jgi:myo-inositol-1(or 4)-monophosphatase
MRIPDEKELLACAVAAAQAGGTHALNNFSRRMDVATRYLHDVKLKLDFESQNQAEAVIHRHYPDHAILGEEGSHDREGAPVRWIIDPIDGTVNFSHGLPYWCTCVAAEAEGRIVAGAVYLPMLGELYTATLNGPAHCNGKEIRVSSIARLDQSLVYSGLLKRQDDKGASLTMAEVFCTRVQKLRVLGSAAAEMVYVAHGRGDGYTEVSINLWDVAAASLIVERAGGRCEIVHHFTPTRFRYICSNGLVHEELRELVRQLPL